MRPASTLAAGISLLCLLIAAVADAQETATAQPSPGRVALSGISPARFNPTHGTVFFTVSGAYFPADPRDVAVIIDDRQLPVSDLSVSRRIVSASYVAAPGANTVTLRAWHASGQVLTSTETVWTGDLTLDIDVTDALGRPLDSGEVVASLSRDPSVSSTVQIREGRAEVVNLPDADIRIEAKHPSGLEAVAVVAARDRWASLSLR